MCRICSRCWTPWKRALPDTGGRAPGHQPDRGQATPQQIGKSLKKLLAERLRYGRGRRDGDIADAEMLVLAPR